VIVHSYVKLPEGKTSPNGPNNIELCRITSPALDDFPETIRIHKAAIRINEVIWG
jgi:hypothetical protein